MNSTVAFYISGHGFGHDSSALEVARALLPGARVVVRSAVAPWLLKRAGHPRIECWAGETDTGVVQLDSLRLDAVETIARATDFMSTFNRRVLEEVAFLRAHHAAMVVADLPPLGIAAAHMAGLSAVALGNFTWDWIYAGYAGGHDLAARIGEIYSHTTFTLRLPMWGGFETMTDVRDIPFVARHSERDPLEVRRALDIPLDEKVVLVSFGGYGLQGATKPHLSGYHVLWPGEFDEGAMYDRGYRYEDVVRAVDVVVTKPGYGIISECIANDTALLYTSRGDFREYPVLVEAMPKYLRCAFIDHTDLFSGHWAPHLDRLLAQPAPPEQPATNGASVAAEILQQELRR